MVAALVRSRPSRIRETVFEARFGYTDELRRWTEISVAVTP